MLKIKEITWEKKLQKKLMKIEELLISSQSTIGE